MYFCIKQCTGSRAIFFFWKLTSVPSQCLVSRPCQQEHRSNVHLQNPTCSISNLDRTIPYNYNTEHTKWWRRSLQNCGTGFHNWVFRKFANPNKSNKTDKTKVHQIVLFGLLDPNSKIWWTKQKFNKMYYVEMVQFDERLFCLICLVYTNFLKNWNGYGDIPVVNLFKNRVPGTWNCY